jgi:hypothetical protein
VKEVKNMTEVLQETITTQGSSIDPTSNITTKNTSFKNTATSAQKIEYIIYFFLGSLEILLAIRFFL